MYIDTMHMASCRNVISIKHTSSARFDVQCAFFSMENGSVLLCPNTYMPYCLIFSISGVPYS